jgi:hypothetical protein
MLHRSGFPSFVVVVWLVVVTASSSAFLPAAATADAATKQQHDDDDDDDDGTPTVQLLWTELYPDYDSCAMPPSLRDDDDNDDNDASRASAKYETPLYRCFNGASMFHNSVDWGDVDIYDEVISSSSSSSLLLNLRRTFFDASHNSTCDGPVDDTYDLPLDECLGPFGAPHPWGRFSIVLMANGTTTKTK